MRVTMQGNCLIDFDSLPSTVTGPSSFFSRVSFEAVISQDTSASAGPIASSQAQPARTCLDELRPFVAGRLVSVTVSKLGLLFKQQGPGRSGSSMANTEQRPRRRLLFDGLDSSITSIRDFSAPGGSTTVRW